MMNMDGSEMQVTKSGLQMINNDGSRVIVNDGCMELVSPGGEKIRMKGGNSLTLETPHLTIHKQKDGSQRRAPRRGRDEEEDYDSYDEYEESYERHRGRTHHRPMPRCEYNRSYSCRPAVRRVHCEHRHYTECVNSPCEVQCGYSTMQAYPCYHPAPAPLPAAPPPPPVTHHTHSHTTTYYPYQAPPPMSQTYVSQTQYYGTTTGGGGGVVHSIGGVPVVLPMEYS